MHMFLEKDLVQDKRSTCDINSLGFAVWVEDASLLYKELCKITQSNNCTLSRFLETHPQDIPRLIDLVKIIDVNEETVSLYKAQHKNEILQGIRKFFIKETFHDFTKMILSLFSGTNEFSYTSSKITIHGVKRITQVHVKIPENAINDWSRMVVTEFEISNFIKREISLKMDSDRALQDAENKEKIVSIISHDLKNPFNTILGFSELLLSKYSTFSEEQVLEFIEYIHESANQSYHLLGNLLQWSKMQKSSTLRLLQIVPIESLVNSVTDLINATCVSKCITIHKDIPQNSTVFADYNMMAFILRNVLTNAIKFSHKNSDIYITSHLENNNTVIIISDKGIGMDSNTQLSLFDPDKVLSRKGTENESGTGIGLMLTKEFIEKQKGTLEIESEENSGTNVIIKIPTFKPNYL